MKTSVIKPGLLVSLKTALRGGVNYARVDLEPEHADSNGGRRARWETSKQIEDAAEFDRATTARSKARAAITAVCCGSSFGLLCPTDQEKELEAAITAARLIVDIHNEGAALCFVDVFVLVGRVAQDDAEAARAIGAEVRELLDAMKAGVAKLDPEAIREAATKARALEAMLSPDVSARVSAAIVEARTAAREIVRRVKAGGEVAARVVSEIKLEKLDDARFAFLDLEQGESQAETPRAAALDMTLDELAQPLRDAGAAQRLLEV